MIRLDADGIKQIVPPLSDADVESLKAGDRVRITGVLYTARDAAHGRLLPLIDAGQPLPVDVREEGPQFHRAAGPVFLVAEEPEELGNEAAPLFERPLGELPDLSFEDPALCQPVQFSDR